VLEASRDANAIGRAPNSTRDGSAITSANAMMFAAIRHHSSLSLAPVGHLRDYFPDFPISSISIGESA
jgi:hypothetical protein